MTEGICLSISAVASMCGIVAAWSLMPRTGVTCQAAQWALAFLIVGACRILAVHVLGFGWLFSGWALVTPTAVTCVFVCLLCAFLFVLHRALPAVSLRDRPATRVTTGRYSRLLWLPIATLAAAYGVFLIDAATRFPTGSDGLHYHLPMAVRWVQTGALDIVKGESVQSYPNNGMILPYLLLSCGLQRLTSLVMVPQAALLVVLVWALAGQLGIAQNGRMIAVCLVMSTPIVIFQSFSSYIDLFGANAWLTSLLALMWASRVRMRAQSLTLCALAGLAGGVAMGSKLTYFPLCAALAVIAWAMPWMGRRTAHTRFASSLGYGIVFCLAGSLCCGFWLVRNAVRTGNPVYPFEVSMVGVTVDGLDLTSYFPERTLGTIIKTSAMYPWFESGGTGYNYGVGHGLGAGFATFVPFGILAFVGGAVRSRSRRPTRSWQVVFVLLVVLGMVLFLTMFHQTFRFVLPVIILSALIAACTFDRIAARRPYGVACLLWACVLLTSVVAVLMPAKEFLGRLRDHVHGRAEFYAIPSVVDELPSGSTIVNVNSHSQNFALLGANLTNHVIGPVRLEDAVRRGTSIAAFANSVKADYLYVVGEPQEDRLTGLHLETVYDTALSGARLGRDRVRLYRIQEGGVGMVSAD